MYRKFNIVRDFMTSQKIHFFIKHLFLDKEKNGNLILQKKSEIFTTFYILT